MHRGYIKLWRCVGANELWTDEPFSRGQAWVDLLMLANHKDGHIRVRGNKVEIKRGQVGWSVLRLADRWQWSRGKVSRFLDELEAVQQIVQQKKRITTVITITKYDMYQGGGTTERATDGTTDGQQTGTNKKGKNVKKKKIRAFDPLLVELPANVSTEIWAEWCQHRVEIRKRMTQTSTTRQLNMLKEQGASANAIISNAIEKGWTGLHPLGKNDKPQDDLPGMVASC